MTEFELKFQVPRERAAAVQAALQRGKVERTRLRARYFDTQGEDLARRGLALRLRQEGRAHVQTAKGRGAGPFERLEHDVPVPASTTEPDPALHAGQPVGEALRRALAEAGSPLKPWFETDVVRRARVWKAAGTTVEIAFDQGHIRAGRASIPVCELEFELKEGSPAALFELAQSWCEAHGLWLDPLPKAAIGRRLALGDVEPAAVTAAEVPQAGHPPALLAAILDSGLQQVLGNARELAAGTGGDEHVHQLRVGLRRLRTALRELTLLADVGAAATQLQPPLKELFGVLGEHRDRSTLLPQLQLELVAAGGPDLAWTPELPDLAVAVRSPVFQSAVLQLVALVHDLRSREDGKPGPARRQLRARLQKLHRRTLRQGAEFDALALPERHTVRKRLKRLRYLSELVRPLFRAADVDRYVDSLKSLQDALGSYQDAVAGRQLLVARAAEDPRAWFGAGWLAAREQALAGDCARACRKAAQRAQAFWK
jgi:triphosphatase